MKVLRMPTFLLSASIEAVWALQRPTNRSTNVHAPFHTPIADQIVGIMPHRASRTGIGPRGRYVAAVTLTLSDHFSKGIQRIPSSGKDNVVGTHPPEGAQCRPTMFGPNRIANRGSSRLCMSTNDLNPEMDILV